MKRLPYIFVAVGVLLAVVAAESAAYTGYVADQLIVTFRRGKGEQFKILKTLKTDTPVEVLEEDGDYVRARLVSGEEGYILKHYITKKLPKAMVIRRLEKKVADLEQQLAKTTTQGRQEQEDLRRQLNQSNEERTTCRQALEQTEQVLHSVTTKYEGLLEDSKNVRQITDQRDRLQAENARMVSELKALKAAAGNRFQTAMIKWFLAGGGVLLAGWIIGKASGRKGSRY